MCAATRFLAASGSARRRQTPALLHRSAYSPGSRRRPVAMIGAPPTNICDLNASERTPWPPGWPGSTGRCPNRCRSCSRFRPLMSRPASCPGSSRSQRARRPCRHRRVLIRFPPCCFRRSWSSGRSRTMANCRRRQPASRAPPMFPRLATSPRSRCLHNPNPYRLSPCRPNRFHRRRPNQTRRLRHLRQRPGTRWPAPRSAPSQA